MPTPSRTGTAAQIDASAGNGNTNVTVPTDCNAVVAMWSHWDDNNDSILSSLTLNSVGFTIRSQLSEANNWSGHGVATLVNPATGTQNVAWTWSAGGARTEGGWIVLIFLKDANTSDIFRAAGTDQDDSGNAVSVTIASASDDLILASCQSFSGVNPGLHYSSGFPGKFV